jgi:hypothetical protein
VQTFHSGITEISPKFHWALTVLVAIVVVSCALYLVFVLVRELKRAYVVKGREDDTEVIDHTLSTWKQGVFEKKVRRVGGVVSPAPLQSPEESTPGAPVSPDTGLAPLVTNGQGATR